MWGVGRCWWKANPKGVANIPDDGWKQALWMSYNSCPIVSHTILIFMEKQDSELRNMSIDDLNKLADEL